MYLSHLLKFLGPLPDNSRADGPSVTAAEGLHSGKDSLAQLLLGRPLTQGAIEHEVQLFLWTNSSTADLASDIGTTPPR